MNRATRPKGKVVFVLGAGFSIPAGAPPQAAILNDIFHLDIRDGRFRKAREALRAFLRNDLRIDPAKCENAALEDIYTPIDRCIADGTALKGKSVFDLVNIRADLEYLISIAIARRIRSHLDADPVASRYVDDFAHYVVEKTARRADLAKDAHSSAPAKAYDPVSSISLNWDILLDNALHSALGQRDPHFTGDYDPFGVVDYCCYISSLDQDDHRIRSGLWSLGCRGYNVKLLKLHGSMNWLQCPNGQRLLVKFGFKEDILNRVGTARCRHCEKAGYDNPLAGSLVMPTFLKDLSNFQIKLVWQNAGVELMEASRIIFIGYSLPHADFEFRQFLSMVHKDAAIDVVLRKGRDADAVRRYAAEKARYEQFFGKRKMDFHSGGVVDFVRSLTAVASAAQKSGNPRHRG